MHPEQKVTQIKRNTIISTLSLFFQSGFSAGLGLAANLVLTIYLSPATFGIYITVLSMISLLNYFSDIGLAASLIQKREISDNDIRTTFTVQQALIITIIALSYVLTPVTTKFYNLPPEGVYLYWALLVAFFVSSLKTIPSVFLERKIQFQKIVLVQIIENTVFYISVIIFAISGFGLHSFTISVLLRALVGFIAIYKISPWQVKIGISRASLKELLSFGLPFQASSFLAIFKDELITLFLGKVVGFEMLGYIGWAKKWAEAPIRIVMDNISRVIFPLIARFQDDKEKVAKLIEKVLYYQTAVIAPSIMGIAMIMSTLVEVIPKYEKWAVALPIFYIFCLSSIFVSLGAPFMNLFNALGKVKISLIFMAIWTVITWIFTPVLVNMFGLYGYPITHLIVSSTYFAAAYVAHRFLKFTYFRVISPFIASALIMGVVLNILKILFLFRSLSFIGFMAIVGALTYFASLKYLYRIDALKMAQDFIKNRSNAEMLS